jgi:hypothetical protein
VVTSCQHHLIVNVVDLLNQLVVEALHKIVELSHVLKFLLQSLNVVLVSILFTFLAFKQSFNLVLELLIFILKLVDEILSLKLLCHDLLDFRVQMVDNFGAINPRLLDLLFKIVVHLLNLFLQLFLCFCGLNLKTIIRP